MTSAAPPRLLLERLDAGARLYIRRLSGGLVLAELCDEDGYRYPEVPPLHALAAASAARVVLVGRAPCGAAVYRRLPPPAAPGLSPEALRSAERAEQAARQEARLEDALARQAAARRAPAPRGFVPGGEVLQSELCRRIGVPVQQGQRLRSLLAAEGIGTRSGGGDGYQRGLHYVVSDALVAALARLGYTLSL